jgi:prepilin signal peptidase PulO-like enzyme (type II secretory pathway)
MDVLLYIYLFILGAIIGSFLNVVIYRLPKKLSLVRPSSRCPQCNKPIKWYDNIPIVSYTLLGGSCRNCHKPISLRYPLIEFINGALYVAAWYKFGESWELLPALFFISVLIVIFFIDLDYYIIPNVIVLPAAAIGLVSMVIIDPDRWLELLLSGVISAAFFFMIVMVMPRGMGMGDVKLVLMLGFFLGKTVLVALFLAFLLGAVTGIVLMFAGVKGRKSQIPFGPFLAMGGITALFYGSWIIEKYTNMWSG